MVYFPLVFLLWAPRTRFALDPTNTAALESDLDYFEKRLGPYFWIILSQFIKDRIPFHFGRLAMSLEGNGKRRVFAIGNYIKQRLLRPYHDWAMSVLRRLPCDGTFNQEQPLKQLTGHRHVFSFDLIKVCDR